MQRQGMEAISMQGPATQGGYAERHGITIALRRPEKITGEMRVPPASLVEGSVHPGALIGFACELASVGTSLQLSPGQSAAPAQIQTTMLMDCRSTSVTGETIPLHAGGPTMIWQTSLHDAAGALVAVVTQSRAVVDKEGRPDEPRAVLQEAARVPAAKLPRNAKAEAGEEVTALPVAEIRRQQIVDAACGIIARKGFANATIREIAAAAGLHVPTMYQYIDSKEALLELVYHFAIRQLHAGLEQASAGCLTARDRLHATIAALLDNCDRYRRQSGVLNREFRSLPREAQQRVLQEYRGFHDHLAGVVAAGVEAGEFRPVNSVIMANVLEAICDIWALRQFAVRDIGLRAFKDEIMRLIDASLCIEADAPAAE
jgi:AcrR family transcriptional regulator/acyl-coenzyme A thioesterase PaaI-like protein